MHAGLLAWRSAKFREAAEISTADGQDLRYTFASISTVLGRAIRQCEKRMIAAAGAM
jgi:hypothetical protein